LDVVLVLSRNQRAAINAAASTRAFHARTGFTRAGQRLWTDEELAALRQHYPDPVKCGDAIPLRTWAAIKGKAQRLGLARPLRVWLHSEEKVVLRDYPSERLVVDIAAAIAKTNRQVWGKANSNRLRRPRKRPLPARDPLADAIRQRAFDLCITLADLDRDLGHGSRFRIRRAARSNRLTVQAVKILGGRLVARIP
jgi:hypothetical protein